jgi:hypothetical protein
MKRSDKAMSGWLKDTVVDPALWIILVASALIASLGDESILRSVRINVGSALVQMGATLLGIVLAGLAIFVVFLDKKYVALLEKIFGIDAEIWPFKWTAIIAIICVTFGLGLIIIGEPQVILFRIIFCGALWSFFYLLWEIYELVKYLATHAKARSKQIQIDNEEKQD